SIYSVRCQSGQVDRLSAKSNAGPARVTMGADTEQCPGRGDQPGLRQHLGTRAAWQQLLQRPFCERTATGLTRPAVSDPLPILVKYRLRLRILERARQSTPKSADQHVLGLGPYEGTFAAEREAQLRQQFRI